MKNRQCLISGNIIAEQVFCCSAERSAEASIHARIRFSDDTLSYSVAKCGVREKKIRMKNIIYNNKSLNNGVLVRSTAAVIVDFDGHHVYY